MVVVVPYPVPRSQKATALMWKPIKQPSDVNITWLEVQALRMPNRAIASLRQQGGDPYPHHTLRIVSQTKPVRFVLAVSNEQDEILRDLAYLATALAEYEQPPSCEELPFIGSNIAQQHRTESRLRISQESLSTPSASPPLPEALVEPTEPAKGFRTSLRERRAQRKAGRKEKGAKISSSSPSCSVPPEPLASSSSSPQYESQINAERPPRQRAELVSSVLDDSYDSMDSDQGSSPLVFSPAAAFAAQFSSPSSSPSTSSPLTTADGLQVVSCTATDYALLQAQAARTTAEGYSSVESFECKDESACLSGRGESDPNETYRSVFQNNLQQRRLSLLSIPEINCDDCFLDEVVGTGAFGKVYRSSWRGAEVAIKFINTDKMTDEDLVSFRREIQMVALLGNHPNVVKLVGACTKPPQLAMVMQLCHRGSVKDYLSKKENPILPWQLVRIARDTSAGLLHLLSEGIVHRDIAARNILLDEALRAYVNDFGMSRSKDLAQTTARTKQTEGPIKWMAPESLMTFGLYSFATDVWSFGVFLYEIMARREPYLGMSNNDVYVGVRNGQIPLTPPEDADPVLRELMISCMQYDDSLRPCMDDIFRRLDRHARDEEYKARASS